MDKKELALWLKTAVCRNAAYKPTVVSIETDAQGSITGMTGNIEIPEDKTKAPATPALTIDMAWNVAGNALVSNNDRGCDLVQRTLLADIDTTK